MQRIRTIANPAYTAPATKYGGFLLTVSLDYTIRLTHWIAKKDAVSAELDGPRIKDVRIVLSAAVDRPTRLFAAERALRGGIVDEANLDQAADAALEEVHIVSDLRGTANERSQSMLVAQVVLGLGFLLFLGYPAVAKVLAA